MSEIQVNALPVQGGWACTVRVADGRGSRSFDVSVSGAELVRFAPSASEPTDLVRRSFEFLLKREAKESILAAFNLAAINRYFPEYEREIKRR